MASGTATGGVSLLSFDGISSPLDDVGSERCRWSTPKFGFRNDNRTR